MRKHPQFDYWKAIVRKSYAHLDDEEHERLAAEFCSTHPGHVHEKRILDFVYKVIRLMKSELFVLWVIALLLFLLLAQKGHSQTTTNRNDLSIIFIDNNGSRVFTAVAPFHFNFTGGTVTCAANSCSVPLGSGGTSGGTL